MTRLLLTLVLLLAPALAEELYRARPETLPEAADEWFGLYAQGKKMGWVRQAVGRMKDGAVVSEYEMKMSLRAFGQDMDVSSRARMEFDRQAPYRLLRATSADDDGTNVVRVRLARDGEEYHTVVESPAGKHERKLALDYAFGDDAAAAFWLLEERAVGDRMVHRIFTVSSLELEEETVTIEAVRTSLVAGVRVRFYEAEMRTKQVAGKLRVTDKGVQLSLVIGGLFEARRETKEEAQKMGRSGDLFVLGTVGIDRPVGEPQGVTEMIVEVPAEAEQWIAAGPRQSLEKRDGKLLLKLGAAHGKPQRATDKEIEEALQDSVESPGTHADMIALSKTAVGDAVTDREKVERLVRFVSEYVGDSFTDQALTALEVARTRRGDCTEHSILFTALARAAGIPARAANGLMYMGDEIRRFGGHQWNEVVLDGHWVPVDPTWTEVEVDATHIALRDQTPDYFGKLTLKLVAFKRR